MAICIECHTTDKSFFAPRCHACNQEVGFFVQLWTQIVYGVIQVAVFYWTLRFAWWLFFT